jgi:GntP family gluconate:H+ symporter
MMTKGKGYEPAYLVLPAEKKEDKNLPSVFLSLLPIIVPLILIAVTSVMSLFGWKDQNMFVISILFLGQPVIALFVGTLFSFLLLNDKGIRTLNSVFETAIEKAGPILIITAAGGMFGMVIKETGIGVEAGTLLGRTGLGLAVPFLIAFLMKTAQGSSTVAIITTASFVEPMLTLLGLDSQVGRLYATLAMGAGSMMISHANDSYFWVITRFSDIKTEITLKIFSTATIIMALTIFACLWVTSLLIL